MTKLSDFTDFEINKRVAIKIGFSPEECDIAKRGTSLVGVKWNEDTGYATHVVDYCNNWSDAGPIIVENRISIDCIHDQGEKWLAFSGDDCEYRSTHKNPLRAAMIVFLEMQK